MREMRGKMGTDKPNNQEVERREERYRLVMLLGKTM